MLDQFYPADECMLLVGNDVGFYPYPSPQVQVDNRNYVSLLVVGLLLGHRVGVTPTRILFVTIKGKESKSFDLIDLHRQVRADLGDRHWLFKMTEDKIKEEEQKALDEIGVLVLQLGTFLASQGEFPATTFIETGELPKGSQN